MASTGGEPRALSFAEAYARVMDGVAPRGSERVPLRQALGRALAEDVRAAHPLPPFDNTAVDGFAVRAADLAGASVETPVALRVRGTFGAGRAPAGIGMGESVRIMTGSAIPAGADAVLPVEDVLWDGAEAARVSSATPPGANIRRAGEDLARGSVALRAGRTLGIFDLALLGALGETRPAVTLRPRVAVISTGDELIPADSPLEPGKIRDTNRPMLEAMAEAAGCTVVTSAHVGDRPADAAAALRDAFAQADAVLTIGGISAGDFEPVKQSLGEFHGIERWRVAMRPGRPQAHGHVNGRFFHALPGNPASVAVVFDTLVRPALLRMGGHAEFERPRLQVRVAEDFPSRAAVTDFARARIRPEGDGWAALPAGSPVSGHLAPQSWANGLLVIPHGVERVAAGERAEFIVWRWPGASSPP